jgi:hypothetical protein
MSWLCPGEQFQYVYARWEDIPTIGRELPLAVRGDVLDRPAVQVSPAHPRTPHHLGHREHLMSATSRAPSRNGNSAGGSRGRRL